MTACDVTDQLMCDKLKEVFKRVVQQYAFSFPEEAQDTEFFEPTIRCDVAFKGVHHGLITIAGPVELSRGLAGDVLGAEEWNVTDAMCRDAFKELGNITCGRWLNETFGRTPEFQIGVPSVKSIASSEWLQLVNAEYGVLLSVNDFPVVLNASLDDESRSS